MSSIQSTPPKTRTTLCPSTYVNPALKTLRLNYDSDMAGLYFGIFTPKGFIADYMDPAPMPIPCDIMLEFPDMSGPEKTLYDKFVSSFAMLVVWPYQEVRTFHEHGFLRHRRRAQDRSPVPTRRDSDRAIRIARGLACRVWHYRTRGRRRKRLSETQVRGHTR